MDGWLCPNCGAPCGSEASGPASGREEAWGPCAGCGSDREVADWAGAAEALRDLVATAYAHLAPAADEDCLGPCGGKFRGAGAASAPGGRAEMAAFLGRNTAAFEATRAAVASAARLLRFGARFPLRFFSPSHPARAALRLAQLDAFLRARSLEIMLDQEAPAKPTTEAKAEAAARAAANEESGNEEEEGLLASVLEDLVKAASAHCWPLLFDPVVRARVLLEAARH